MNREQHQQECIEMITAQLDEAKRQYYELANKHNPESIDSVMQEFEGNLHLAANPPTHKDQLGHVWQECRSGAWRLWNGTLYQRAEPAAGSVLTCLSTKQQVTFE